MRKIVLLVSCALVLAACGDDTDPPSSADPSSTTPAVSASPTPSPSDNASSPAVGGDPLTLLLVGVDRETGTQRADVIMLVRIDEEREHASAMSIHRDTWVEVPRHGENKINAAYAFGGEELLAETVDTLYRADIDHTLVADFDAFSELSQILGPLTIDTADGPVTLEGDDALSFVRERYSLPGGDFDRVRRQQAYLEAAAESIRSAGPGELLDLAQLAGDYVMVDGEDGLLVHRLVLDLVAETEETETMVFSAPHGGTGWSDDGQSIILVDDEAVETLGSAYETDTVDDWLANNEAETLDSRPIR